jgi:hypothetical protein
MAGHLYFITRMTMARMKAKEKNSAQNSESMSLDMSLVDFCAQTFGVGRKVRRGE